jgi:hypothetical protein
VRAYGQTFLGALVHDVNLVHGALDRLGVQGAIEPIAAADWAGGDAASFTARLPGGAIWNCAWLLLRGLMDFRERACLYFADAIHELDLPAPYWPASTRVHRMTGVRDGEHAVSVEEYAGDAYLAELHHFHACVVDGVACRTPPEQALCDIELLRDLFMSRVQRPTGSPARSTGAGAP